MELINYEKKTIVEFYANKNTKVIIDKIEGLAKDFAQDMTTEKGRKEIASYGRKISSSKTYLEKIGLGITEEARKTVSTVNEEKKFIIDSLNRVRDEFLAPLVEFRNKEKVLEEECKRVDSLIEVTCRRCMSMETLKELNCAMATIDLVRVPDGAGLLWYDAILKSKLDGISYIKTLINTMEEKVRIKDEADALAKEKEEFEQQKREEQIRKDAADAARKEAEEKAASEKQKIIDDAKEEADSQKRMAEEFAQREADDKKKIADDLALAKEKEALAETEKIEAKKQADEDKARAIVDERKRVALVAQKKKEEDDARAADVAHRKDINNCILKDLCSHGELDVDTARKVVEVVARGLVSNLSIRY